MNSRTNSGRRGAVALLAALAFQLICSQNSKAEVWESLDRNLKPRVFQVNVAIKVKLDTGLYAQLADVSSRKHYPVFATTPEDKGFRVVGYGTCFPVQTSKKDHTYFLTNQHVVDYGSGMLQECRRFFAAMRLQAERTKGLSTAESRYRDLMGVVNLSMKSNLNPVERSIYQATVDSIWDTYDNHLSLKADPQRTAFMKYLAQAGVQGSTEFFIHPYGPASNGAISAELFKGPKDLVQPDLAVLSSATIRGLPVLELDSHPVAEGQPIQAIGYPVSEKKDAATSFYAPTFSTGRISRVMPGLIEFDAPVSKGNSGGPLVNQQGKVIGVVVRRSVSSGPSNTDGQKNSNEVVERFATAIDASTVRRFASELFK